MLCDTSHETLILTDPVMTVRISFLTCKECCTLPTFFNGIYKRDKIPDYECSMCCEKISSKKKKSMHCIQIY